jgi:hypothetical protein
LKRADNNIVQDGVSGFDYSYGAYTEEGTPGPLLNSPDWTDGTWDEPVDGVPEGCADYAPSYYVYCRDHGIWPVRESIFDPSGLGKLDPLDGAYHVQHTKGREYYSESLSYKSIDGTYTFLDADSYSYDDWEGEIWYDTEGMDERVTIHSAYANDGAYVGAVRYKVEDPRIYAMSYEIDVSDYGYYIKTYYNSTYAQEYVPTTLTTEQRIRFMGKDYVVKRRTYAEPDHNSDYIVGLRIYKSPYGYVCVFGINLYKLRNGTPVIQYGMICNEKLTLSQEYALSNLGSGDSEHWLDDFDKGVGAGMVRAAMIKTTKTTETED